MKKGIELQHIYRMAEQVTQRYEDISAFFLGKEIPRRISKVFRREKVKESPVPINYKSTEEVIPASPPPKEITELLERV
jgi:hypothetical protein